MITRVSRVRASCGSIAMLDVIYLATGAAFLYACVLYAFACDHL
jgi:hypothetical protein